MTCTYRSAICQGKILAKPFSKTRQIEMRICAQLGEKNAVVFLDPKPDLWSPSPDPLLTGISLHKMYSLHPPAYMCSITETVLSAMILT